MILDLDDITFKEEKSSGSPSITSEKGTQLLSTSPQVIKRVLHIRQEFMIYPNGQIYPGKPQSWFEDKAYEVKKKEPKKAKEIKKLEVKKVEEY
mgnify:FL=1